MLVSALFKSSFKELYTLLSPLKEMVHSIGQNNLGEKIIFTYICLD